MRVIERVLLTAMISVPAAAHAATPPACGPDCRRPGHYLVCNDGLDANPTAGGALGLDFVQWVCAAFTPPTAAAFTLEGAVVLFAPTGGGNGTLFEQRVYGHPNTMPAPPPPQVMPAQAGNLQIPATVMPRFYDMPLTPTYALTGAFRMCFLGGLDDMDMGFVYDSDGAPTGRNFTNIRSGWRNAADDGVPGDFVIRASVLTTEMGPWMPGGECSGMDAGVRDGGGQDPDTGGGVDPDGGSDPDGGAAGVDARVADDASASADATTAADASADASVVVGDDASAAAVDASGAAPDAATPLPPPTITTISPDRGSSAAEVSVIVTGTGFVAGSVLKLGAITTNEIRVAGSTTINARVPPGIAAGQHDVIVQNPDGQAAVLAKGYTVIAGSPAVADGCSCAAPRDRPLAGTLLVLGALGLGRRRRSERSQDGSRGRRSRTAPVHPRHADVARGLFD